MRKLDSTLLPRDISCSRHVQNVINRFFPPQIYQDTRIYFNECVEKHWSIQVCKHVVHLVWSHEKTNWLNQKQLTRMFHCSNCSPIALPWCRSPASVAVFRSECLLETCTYIDVPSIYRSQGIILEPKAIFSFFFF